MKNGLELLFNIEVSKKKLQDLNYKNEKIERWNKDLEKVEDIYKKISFLKSRGIKVERVCCTQFKEKDANDGFYPYLRFPQFLAIFHPIHDNSEFDFGGGSNGELSGKFSCESLIKKVSKYCQ